MSTTLNDLVIGSMRLINVVKSNETPSPDDMKIALQSFDQMLDGWSNEKLMVYNTSESIFYTKAGQQEYQLGPCMEITGFNPPGYVPPGTNTSVSGVILTNSGSSTLPVFQWNNLTTSVPQSYFTSSMVQTPTYEWFMVNGYNPVLSQSMISTNGGVSYTANPITINGSAPTIVQFEQAAFNGTSICAYNADNQTFVTATDGIHFTSVASPIFGGSGGNMVFGKGLFVIGINVTGIYSPFPVTPYILTSPDGVTWTTHTGPIGIAPNLGYYGAKLTFNGSIFIYAPTQYTGTTCTYATSLDGLTWTTHTLPALASSNYVIVSIMSNASKYCIVLQDWSSNAVYSFVSSDSIAWAGGLTTITEANLLRQYYDLGTATSNTFYIKAPLSNNMYYSTDGLNWTASVVPGAASQWYGITNNGSTITVSGVKGANAIYSSTYLPSYTGGTYPLTFTSLSGTGAQGTYTISSATGSVSNISLTAGGSGYTSAPAVSFLYGGINGATATASIPYASSGGQGYINGVYANVPLISLTGNGQGATGTLTVQNNAVLTISITTTNIAPGAVTAGGGYGYLPGDQITASNQYLGGSGAGFAAVVTSTTGGDWAVERPVRIEEAYTIWNDPTSLQAVDIPIGKLNVNQWAAIAVKNTPSTFGFGLYADNNFPITNVKLWPIPNMTTAVRLWLRNPLADFTDLNQVVSYPPGYERAMRFCLAVELAAEFGKEIPEIVLQTAIKAKTDLASLNAFPRYMQGDGGLNSRRHGFNWITGGFANWPSGASW